MSGFWLVFGHGAPNRRRLETKSAASMGLIDRAGAVDLHAVDDTPAEIIERFFLEVARRRFGPRVQSVGVWSAYKCGARNAATARSLMPCLGDWRAGAKNRAGGTVWYLDCALAVGYVSLPPEPGPKALPAPSAAIKGMPTRH